MPNSIQFCRASHSRGTASNMSSKDKYYSHINCEYKAPQKNVNPPVLIDRSYLLKMIEAAKKHDSDGLGQ
jgi:hypothetical protein